MTGLREIICESCGQYESECKCKGEKMDIREQIADIIQEDDSEGYRVENCRDLSKDMAARTIRQSYLKEADSILALLKEHGWEKRIEVDGEIYDRAFAAEAKKRGYVRMAEDQILPKAPIIKLAKGEDPSLYSFKEGTEAQRDADHSYYAPLIEKLQEESEARRVLLMQMTNTAELYKNQIKQARQDALHALLNSGYIQAREKLARQEGRKEVVETVERLDLMLLHFDADGKSYTESPLNDAQMWQAQKTLWGIEK